MKVDFPDVLIAAAKDGDHDAIEAIVRGTYDYLMGLLVRRTDVYSHAEEALSATYETMLRRLDRYKHHGKLYSWLSTVALGELWHIERRERIRLGPKIHEDSAWYEHVEDEVFEHIGTSNAATLLTVLNDQQRTVLELRYLYGLTPREIETRLGMTQSATKSMTHKSVKLLRTRLGSLEAYEQRPDRQPRVGVRNNSGI